MEDPLYDYESLFWAIEWEVIPEVANFKDEGLVTPEGWEGEKEILEIYWSMRRELNLGVLGEMPECWPLHYPDIVIIRSIF